MGSKRVGIIGVMATLAYLIIIFVLFDLNLSEIRNMPPNEVGDFFAGIVGPIAICWLILGFFQQGLELRNSVETLKLQAKELANSVEQQKELVQVTKEQLSHDSKLLQRPIDADNKSRLPLFVVSTSSRSSSSHGTRYQYEVLNEGATVNNVLISADLDTILVGPRRWPVIARNQSLHFYLDYEPAKTQGFARVTLEFSTVSDGRFNTVFRIGLGSKRDDIELVQEPTSIG